MIKKLIKGLRWKWHNDQNIQYNDLKEHLNDLNYKIEFLMNQLSYDKPDSELSFLFDKYCSDKGSMYRNNIQ